jgi:hypothetical protein
VRVQLTGAAALPDPLGGAPRAGGVLLDVDAVGLRRAAADWTAAIAAGDRP